MHRAVKDHQHPGLLGMRNTLLSGRYLALAIIIFALSAYVPQANAQTDLANIVGTITDSSGAAVPNSQVEIKNEQTSAIRNVTTDANGFYSAPSLTVGTYSITVAVPNFKKSTQTAVLTLNGLTANFQLTVGSTSQEVTVNGAASSTALQTDSHDVSVSLSSAQLVNLPNNGRSILTIATLGPASQPGTDSGVDPGDESFYGQLSSAVIIAGLQNSHTLFLQDGVDNTNLLTQTANILASVEATQEVNTLLNGAPARFSQPAVINVITKSGSNQFHGTAYDFLQNDAANAVNWFAITKPPERYNQFGANFGGPILKNKLFGFFDYSGLRSHTGDVVNDRVPTAAERAGNFRPIRGSSTTRLPITQPRGHRLPSQETRSPQSAPSRSYGCRIILRRTPLWAPTMSTMWLICPLSTTTTSIWAAAIGISPSAISSLERLRG